MCRLNPVLEAIVGAAELLLIAPPLNVKLAVVAEHNEALVAVIVYGVPLVLL
jgi:hypothetical protein